jgi:RimJ/RimL family protein N-acetyltransferase
MNQTEQPVFRLAGGLELRPWHAGDAKVLADSRLDPDMQQWNRPGRLSLDDARKRIVRWGNRWRSEEAAVWAIAEPGEGSPPVGLIGLADFDLDGGSAEFLYWLLPAGRGRGAMVDAVARVSR